jgi:hypothetical protein
MSLALSADFNLMYSENTEVVLCIIFASDQVVSAGLFICLRDKFFESTPDQTSASFDPLLD